MRPQIYLYVYMCAHHIYIYIYIYIYVQVVICSASTIKEVQIKPSEGSLVSNGSRKLLTATAERIQASFQTTQSKTPDHFAETPCGMDVGLGATQWTRQQDGTTVTSMILTSAVSIRLFLGTLSIYKQGELLIQWYGFQFWHQFVTLITDKINDIRYKRVMYTVGLWLMMPSDTKTRPHQPACLALVLFT